MTAKGTFYPFEEAHELFLQYLIDNHNIPNAKIANKWDFVDSSKMKLIAEITDETGVKEDVIFDFIPNDCTETLLSGYSKDLSSPVILNTFSRRKVCIKLYIPEAVKSDIFDSSYATREESRKRLEALKEILSNKKFDCAIKNLPTINNKEFKNDQLNIMRKARKY